MGKYDPLRRYLRRRREDIVHLTYGDIELIIGGLLPHAAAKPVWWANDPQAARGLVQCSAWLDAGFQVADVRGGQSVCFHRRLVRRGADD